MRKVAGASILLAVLLGLSLLAPLRTPIPDIPDYLLGPVVILVIGSIVAAGIGLVFVVIFACELLDIL